MMIAGAGGRKDVRGRRIAIPEVGPMPGRTPTRVPSTDPTSAGGSSSRPSRPNGDDGVTLRVEVPAGHPLDVGGGDLPDAAEVGQREVEVADRRVESQVPGQPLAGVV